MERITPRECFVYFARRTTGGLIKIGVSKTPKHRLSQLRAQYGNNLQFLACVVADYATEQRLHKGFDDIRVFGEWFKPRKDLRDLVAECKETGVLPRRFTTRIDDSIYAGSVSLRYDKDPQDSYVRGSGLKFPCFGSDDQEELNYWSNISGFEVVPWLGGAGTIPDEELATTNDGGDLG